MIGFACFESEYVLPFHSVPFFFLLHNAELIANTIKVEAVNACKKECHKGYPKYMAIINRKDIARRIDSPLNKMIDVLFRNIPMHNPMIGKT
jgi:hypothetical protein